MSKSTGPILVAGGLNWANQTLFGAVSKESTVDKTVQIGVATGLLAAAFYGIEKLSTNLAVGLAYTMLVTSMLVRINNQPTPVERLATLIK